MMPNPKSEAWLLCALKENPYQSCARLETSIPGNDNAVHPAKIKLDERLTEIGRSNGDIIDMLTNRIIDPNRIDMPSFNRFKERLKQVTREMCGLPPPP
jgi:hypothetical protein